MKNLVVLMLFAAFLLSGCIKKVESKRDAAIESAKKVATEAANSYLKELKSILVREMKNGGPEAVFAVCSDTAQQFTKKFSTEKGIEIKRVAFLNRNDANIPDAGEMMWLKEFENMMKGSSFNKDTVLFRVEKTGKETTLHLVKPILLAEECVVCHGSEEQIPEGIKKLIDEKYPNDKATNFKPGDLRGAVSVVMKIKQKK